MATPSTSKLLSQATLRTRRPCSRAPPNSGAARRNKPSGFAQPFVHPAHLVPANHQRRTPVYGPHFGRQCWSLLACERMRGESCACVLGAHTVWHCVKWAAETPTALDTVNQNSNTHWHPDTQPRAVDTPGIHSSQARFFL